MKINYHLLHKQQLTELPQNATLLLHSCCAPCSSYVIEYLSEFFEITILFYNPNIHPQEEYQLRYDELCEYITIYSDRVHIVEIGYDPQEFYDIAKGLEHCREGTQRCFKCYELRLAQAKQYADQHSFDYFTTALSISPHKNSQIINEIGNKLFDQKNGSIYLNADFKKNNGFKRSCELSTLHNLYRQDYCGCEYSKLNR